MKDHMSVFSMITRHSWGRSAGILAGLILANGIVFGIGLRGGFTDLRPLLDQFSMLAVFLVAFALMSLVLCAALCDRGGKQNYFLNRLRISPKRFYLTHALYNAICYGLLFVVESLSLLGLCFYARWRYPEGFNAQSIVLACYRSDVLHSFFPLQDILGWVTLAVTVLGLGCCTAAFPTQNRCGKASFTTLLMCASAVLYLVLQVENGAVYIELKVLMIAVTVFFALISLVGCMSLEVEEDA